MRCSEHTYQTVCALRGPLLFLEQVFAARIGELVTVVAPDDRRMDGEVLKADRSQVLIQVYGETQGLDRDRTRVILQDTVKQAPLGEGVLGRVFDGSFVPRDQMPMFIPDHWAPISGAPMNPVAREHPEEMIETGISCIDGLNTLVKGQKLPIFSCAGLPARELTDQLLRQARVPGGGPFVVGALRQ